MISIRLFRVRPIKQVGLQGRRLPVTAAHCWHARRAASVLPGQVRFASNKSTADEVIEEIQDQYATAKDEFDIAIEETEKQTVYAEDDRGAARQELNKLHEVYGRVVNGPDAQLADEVRNRVGQRIRELDNAVKNLEELAQNQD